MKLLLPNEKHYESYIDAIHEYKQNGVDTYAFLKEEKHILFQRFENYRLGKNLPENRVPATYLWLIDNGELIGEVSIRHSLTPDLLRYGGNIGYGVRYSKWKSGYGTAMLRMALAYAKEELGLDKVLITCDDDNIGSVGVIEKNGGVLQDKIKNRIDGKAILTRRYWIAFKAKAEV